MSKKVALYGASSDINEILDILKEYHKSFYSKICFICDSNSKKHNKFIGEIKIVSPERLVECDTVIICASFFDDIYSNIKKINANIKVFVSPYMYIMAVCDKGKNYEEHIAANKEYMSKRDLIKSIYEVNDERTRSVLESCFYQRSLKPYELLEYDKMVGNQLDNNYFVDWIMDLSSKVSYIDCGAYDGDSIFELMSRWSHCVETIYAFEPEKSNCEKLAKNISDWGYEECTQIYQIALSDKAGVNAYDDECDTFKRSECCDGKLIDEIALDDLQICVKTPCIYKMDCEGSEIEILLGSKNFIRKNKPILMVCLYHRYSDIWTIPSIIKTIYNDYRFYLSGGIHVFLIAIPK